MYDNHELMAAVELSAKFYVGELLNGVGEDRNRARGYIGQRRLFAPMVEQFSIGYAPRSGGKPWILTRMGEEELLLEAGILNRSDDGRLYDPMAGRVVFPQVNPAGKFLGFVGRDIGTKSPDKYLSTGSTAIFRRAEVLYRIDKARRSIESTRSVIVVEGLLDAALLSQVGIRNVVATGTKAMTDAQAQVLARYAKRVEVMFDNDKHGRDGFEDVKRRRGGYFEYIGWKAYPSHFNDPAEWVAAQIDRSITNQGSAVTVG